MKFAKRAGTLRPSPVFELLKRAGKMRAEGKDIISLSIGELKWGTYQPIKDAAKKAIDEDFTKYTGSAGREELRNLIKKDASSIYGLDVETENVCISSGCKFALFSAFQILCNDGDEVIFPSPYWMSYPDIISLSGAKSVIVPTDESSGFKITPEQLEKSITKKTKIFLLNSPNNPTSAIYTEEELKKLGEVLKKYPEIFIITDEIYDQIVFEGSRAPLFLKTCPELKNRMICLNGASKNYLMTGWRISWVIAPKEFIKVFSAFHSQSVSCVSSVAQKAIEDGLHLCTKDIKTMVSNLKERRDHMIEGLKKIPGIKIYPADGAFYIWVGVKDLLGKSYKGNKISSSRDLMEQLLVQKNLLCLSGEEFGTPGHLRFSYGLEKEDLNKANSRISEFVSELT